MYAQSEESGPDFTTAELAYYVVGASSYDKTKFTLTSMGASYYCKSSEGCNINIERQNSHFAESIEIEGSLACNKVGHHVQLCNTFTFQNAICSGTNITNGAKALKKGLFKIIINVKKYPSNQYIEKTFVYYDNRDSRFPSGSQSNCACTETIANDLFIRYNYYNDKLEYQYGGDNENSFIVAELGEWLSIEGLNAFDEPCYDNYQERLFAVITSINRNQSDNPTINWLPIYGNEYAFLYYQIERSINNGYFEQVAVIEEKETNHFVDDLVWWDPNSTGELKLTYRIVSYYEIGGHQYSNQKSIFVTEEYPQKKYQASLQDEKPKVSVSPNPFNGSTLINLSNIPLTAEIKVIDLLGREYELAEVTSTRNERQLRFEGNNLSSGIYFVVVRDYSSIYSKKIILLK